MNKELLRTLLVYHGENGDVFKSDVVIAMLLNHLDDEGKKIAQMALEIKAETDQNKSSQSSQGIA